MKSVIVTARTREEAIEKALKELGVERHEVHVEILEEGSRGFFGLGAKDVKIRVTADNLPDDAPETSAESPSVGDSQSPRSSRQREQARRGGERRRQRNDRTRRSTPRPPASTPAVAEKIESTDTNTAPAESPAEPAEQAAHETPIECDKVRALLEEVIRLMGIQATVVAKPAENGELQLIIESDDSSLLIGRKGRTLQALQYLINRMAHAAEESDAPDRIVIDIAGYLDRRKAALEDVARRVARRVKETGKNIKIKPMSPQERRIIHVTLQDDPDVRTFSVGEAGSRCVVVAPREERAQKRRTANVRNRRGQGRRPQNGRRQPRRGRQPSDISSRAPSSAAESSDNQPIVSEASREDSAIET